MHILVIQKMYLKLIQKDRENYFFIRCSSQEENIQVMQKDFERKEY